MKETPVSSNTRRSFFSTFLDNWSQVSIGRMNNVTVISLVTSLCSSTGIGIVHDWTNRLRFSPSSAMLAWVASSIR